jgi:hypothetical protein
VRFRSLVWLASTFLAASLSADATIRIWDAERLQVLLTLHHPASAAVVEEAKVRVLQAVAAEQPGRPFPRAETRLFPPHGGGSGGSVEQALQGFVSLPIVTNGRLTGLLALGGRGAAKKTLQRFLDQRRERLLVLDRGVLHLADQFRGEVDVELPNLGVCHF